MTVFRAWAALRSAGIDVILMPPQYAPQSLRRARISFEIERCRILQIGRRDRARDSLHRRQPRRGIPTIACSSSIATSGSTTLMVRMPISRAGFRLMPRSSR